MTTKKQRREQVAERRAKFDEETRRMGLEAQLGDRLYREQRMADAERSARSRNNAAAARAVKEATIPDNVAESYANAQAAG